LHKPTESEIIDYLLDVFPNYPTAGKSNNVWSVARPNPKLTPLIAKLVRIARSLFYCFILVCLNALHSYGGNKNIYLVLSCNTLTCSYMTINWRSHKEAIYVF